VAYVCRHKEEIERHRRSVHHIGGNHGRNSVSGGEDKEVGGEERNRRGEGWRGHGKEGKECKEECKNEYKKEYKKEKKELIKKVESSEDNCSIVLDIT